MEKICGLIGIICLAGYAYMKNWTGYEGHFLGFLAVGVVGFGLAYTALLFAYHIPKLVTIASLRISRMTLRLVYLTVRKTDRINAYRLGQVQRFKNKFDVTRLLLRKNSSLNMEIEKLRAEVSTLNKEIKMVVSTWSPVLKETLEVRPRQQVLDRPTRSEMTFVESAAKTTEADTKKAETNIGEFIVAPTTQIDFTPDSDKAASTPQEMV